jgi:ATP-dependent DNA helicase RecG
MNLATTPVTRLKGVGPKQAEKLARLKITTVQDVLFHLPLRYQDRTREVPIVDLAVGLEAVFTGTVVDTEILLHRRRSMVCTLEDNTGVIRLRFFHFNNQQRERLRVGAKLSCFGEVRRGRQSLEVVHPEYQVVSSDQSSLLASTLTPVYPVTEGLHQLAMRKITDQALQHLESVALSELIPAQGFGITLSRALEVAHRPPPALDTVSLLSGSHEAIQRLALEELVAHRVSMQRVREVARRLSAPEIERSSPLCRALIEALPFKLTGAQRRVIDEIAEDMATPAPMLRLIQGDVGSGKTMVAAAAAAMVVGAGYQVAIMAPTEILAEQHLSSFSSCFEPLGLKIGWLKGKLGARQRRDAIESIALGHTDIVVGTHALFQSDVEFARLGLTIVDEQHRFGVHQRLSLREKGVQDKRVPHQLTMTATPIPRTLAMTAYADLDCSVIDELPPGRQSIRTVAIPVGRRNEVIERVAAAIAEGRQVYWVCTLVEES